VFEAPGNIDKFVKQNYNRIVASRFTRRVNGSHIEEWVQAKGEDKPSRAQDGDQYTSPDVIEEVEKAEPVDPKVFNCDCLR